MLAFPKTNAVRSEPYRRYVASLPCFACGRAGISQAAHSNSGSHGKGLGLKADDRNVFPLCATQPMRVGCHDQFDLLIDMTLDDRRELETRYSERMQAQAENDGWNLATLKRNA
jgi:hypothetical protein